jgi:hypothetical protein
MSKRRNIVEIENKLLKDQLSGLREELDGINEIYMDGLNERLDLIQRLTAAEQRNKKLENLLGRARNRCDRPNDYLGELIDAALKPTESGASE